METTWNTHIKPELESTPKFILLREAKLLTSSTEKVLTGKVKSKMNILKSLFSDGKEMITHKFVVSSTSMEFEFTLLEAHHEVLNTFPVQVKSSYIDGSKLAANLDEFEAIIKSIIEVEEVTKAINSLYQQSLLMNKEEQE